MVLASSMHLPNRFVRYVPNLQSIFINCGLIVIGCIVYVIGMNSILVPQKLLSGGLVGITLIIHYLKPSLNIGLIYFLLNVPLFLMGWFNVGRRFMIYSIFGMIFFSSAAGLVHVRPVTIDDPFLAAIFAGVICGVGGGVILRSLGSAGGLDIIAVYLNKRLGFRPGTVVMGVNSLVLLAGAGFFELEKALYSVVYVYASSKVIDAVLTGFNRRKSLLVVSKESPRIAQEILSKINRGVTLLQGKGGYSGEEREVIFTVTTLTELPKMKDIIFSIDQDAFVVVNDTLEVLGKRHGTRRAY